MEKSSFCYLFLIDGVEYSILSTSKPLDVLPDFSTTDKKKVITRRNSTSSVPIIFTPPPVTNTKSWEEMDRGFFQSPTTDTNNTNINNFDPFQSFSNTKNNFDIPEIKAETNNIIQPLSFDSFDNFSSSIDDFSASVNTESIASSFFNKVNENETKMKLDIKPIIKVDSNSLFPNSVFDSFPTSDNAFENFSFDESFGNKSNLTPTKAVVLPVNETPDNIYNTSITTPIRARRQSAAEISKDFIGLTLDMPVNKISNAISDLIPSPINPQTHHHHQQQQQQYNVNNFKKNDIKPVLSDKNKEIWGNSKLINLDLNLDSNKPINATKPIIAANVSANKSNNLQKHHVNPQFKTPVAPIVKAPASSLDNLKWN